MYGYRQSKRYSNSSGYAPSAQKLFVDIKDIIEQTFPRLNQDIIDDALTYGIHQYTEYLLTDDSEVDSDEEAKEFFLNLVMKRILEHNRRQHDTLIAFMLAHQRHNTQNPLTVNQALNQSFSSDLLTLPFPPGQLQKMVEPILEENRNKFTQQRLRFPEGILRKRVLIPEFLKDTARIDQFWSLSDKLQKQVIRIGIIIRDIMNCRDINVLGNVFIQIFDEIYNLSISTSNSNQLERLLIDSVSHIIRNSSLTPRDKTEFMRYFGETINNQDNFTYYQAVSNNINF